MIFRLIVAAVATVTLVSAALWVLAMVTDARNQIVYITGGVFFVCLSVILAFVIGFVWFVAVASG